MPGVGQERSRLLAEHSKAPLPQARLRQFLHGYVLGFLLALIALLCYDHLSEKLRLQREHSSATEHWLTGYAKALQNLHAETQTLSRHLEHEVRILCMVLTSPSKHWTQAAHVRATWGKRCTRLIFLSSQADAELGAVAVVPPEADTYELLWHKVREGFRYVLEHFAEDYDWFLKADDDTYVIMENLRYSLYAYPAEIPILMGYKLEQLNVTYVSGGAGYVLSKAALRRVVFDGFTNETLCPAAAYTLPEDYSISICLQNVGTLLLDARDSLAKEHKQKMFPLQLYNFMDSNETLATADWIADLTPYKMEWGLDCCSNHSVSFHYIHPFEMYLYEYLIYNLRAANLPQPSHVLPTKLDQISLKRRFVDSWNETGPLAPLEWVRIPK